MTLFDLKYPAHEFITKRSSYRGTSLQDFFAAFPDEETCWRHLAERRYKKLPPCPRCGRNMRSGWGLLQRDTHRRCRSHRSASRHTIFHRTGTPLQLWFYAMLLFCNSSGGFSHRELSRHLGINPKTASKVSKGIRTQMAALEYPNRLGRRGHPVEVSIKVLGNTRVDRFHHRNVSRVFFLCDGSRVDSKVTHNAIEKDFFRIIDQKCQKGVELFTTSWPTYRVMCDYGRRKPRVEYVSRYRDVWDNMDSSVYGFLVLFRRTFLNTYKSVWRRNLWLYLKEYEFRYNRHLRSQDTFWDLVSEFPRYSPARYQELADWNSQLPDWEQS